MGDINSRGWSGHMTLVQNPGKAIYFIHGKSPNPEDSILEK